VSESRAQVASGAILTHGTASGAQVASGAILTHGTASGAQVASGQVLFGKRPAPPAPDFLPSYLWDGANWVPIFNTVGTPNDSGA